jgi:hypothetical protein
MVTRDSQPCRFSDSDCLRIKHRNTVILPIGRSQEFVSSHYSIEIKPAGPLPDFYSIAEHLWGTGCDVDSDGDCIASDDRQWTELTLSLRATPGERLDIDPISIMPLALVIRASQAALCQRAADFIVSVSGGSVGATVNVEPT